MPEEIYRIVSVEARKPYVLNVTWEDKINADVDVSDYITSYKMYAPLRDKGWTTPNIEEYGGAVEWSDEIDMSSDTLRMLWLFQTGQAMHPKDFNDWMERNKVSLTTAAEALGISRRMVGYYKSGDRTIPRYILLACRGYDEEQIIKERMKASLQVYATCHKVKEETIREAQNAMDFVIVSGQISSFGIRKKLSTTIPGFIRIAAKAEGVTQKAFVEKLDKGEINTTTLLPRMAAAFEKEGKKDCSS